MRPNIWFWVTPKEIGILPTVLGREITYWGQLDCYGVALDLPKRSFFSSYLAKPFYYSSSNARVRGLPSLMSVY